MLASASSLVARPVAVIVSSNGRAADLRPSGRERCSKRLRCSRATSSSAKLIFEDKVGTVTIWKLFIGLLIIAADIILLDGLCKTLYRAIANRFRLPPEYRTPKQRRNRVIGDETSLHS